MKILSGVLVANILLVLSSAATAEVLVRISQEELATYQLTEIGDHAWLAARSGAYRVDGQVLKKIFEEPVYTIKSVGNEIWLSTNRGVFRADRNQSPFEPVAFDEDKLGNLEVSTI